LNSKYLNEFNTNLKNNQAKNIHLKKYNVQEEELMNKQSDRDKNEINKFNSNDEMT